MGWRPRIEAKEFVEEEELAGIMDGSNLFSLV